MPRLATVPDGVSYTEVVGERASNAGVILFTFVVFALVLCVVVGACQLAVGSVTACPVVLGVILAALASMSVHIAQQWEKVVVLRLGAFNRVSGPGLFWTWPIIEQNTMRVDTRVRVTTFGAEETLTADLVPLNVNAVLFWHVWDAKAACTEVGDFSRAVELAAPERRCAMRSAVPVPPRSPFVVSSSTASSNACWRKKWRRGASPFCRWKCATSCCRRSCRM